MVVEITRISDFSVINVTHPQQCRIRKFSGEHRSGHPLRLRQHHIDVLCAHVNSILIIIIFIRTRGTQTEQIIHNCLLVSLCIGL